MTRNNIQHLAKRNVFAFRKRQAQPSQRRDNRKRQQRNDMAVFTDNSVLSSSSVRFSLLFDSFYRRDTLLLLRVQGFCRGGSQAVNNAEQARDFFLAKRRSFRRQLRVHRFPFCSSIRRSPKPVASAKRLRQREFCRKPQNAKSCFVGLFSHFSPAQDAS